MPPKISADARKYLAVQCVTCHLAAGSGYMLHHCSSGLQCCSGRFICISGDWGRLEVDAVSSTASSYALQSAYKYLVLVIHDAHTDKLTLSVSGFSVGNVQLTVMAIHETCGDKKFHDN